MGNSMTASRVAALAKVDLTNKIVLVTGANTGIGLETVRVLARDCKATVVLACRNVSKAEAAIATISGTDDASLSMVPMQLDLSDFASIRKFAADYKSLFSTCHALILNAGVMATPQSSTKDGFELQVGTNHFGHFLLTSLLLDTVKASAPARIVVVSSTAHTRGMPATLLSDINSEKGYTAFGAYAQSKLANLLFSRELDRRLQLEGANVRTYCLHPGVVDTELARNSTLAGFFWAVGKPFLKTAEQGAATTVYCAIAPELEGVGGKYYDNCAEATSTAAGADMVLAGQLWELTERLIAEKTAAAASS